MRQTDECYPIYIRFNKSLNPYTENLIKEQLLNENPKLANNPNKLNKEVMNRAEKMIYLDSSYFLG